MNKLFFSLSLGVISSILALPSGHSVKHGSAKVASQGDQVVITSGKSAVIHWDQFSVAKSESAKFQMQDSKSSVLNRVTGGNKSEILGRMESNGKVYLLNPKGVLFGKDCEINVGGLVASTLDALDADYIKGGELFFDGDSSALIVNLGKISSAGGDVHLLAQRVENSGSIDANHVGLASGSKILIKPEGNERIFVKAGNGSIDHSGNIKATVAELKTKSAYEMAINCSGTIEGVRAENVNGRIFLSADGGKVLVNSELHADGGNIVVDGRDVTLEESSLLNVSSEGQAGTIHVGPMFNAETVDVKPGAQLLANGRAGGKIYLLSQKDTYFRGHLSARGWDDFDGGFAELSSKENVWHKGTVDFRSDRGKFGGLLIDPGFIDILSGSGAFGPNTYFDTEINAMLGVGNLTFDTSLEPGGAAEIITFGTGVAISWSADTTLTLLAGQSIDSSGAYSITNTSVAATVPALVMTGSGVGAGNYFGVDCISGTISSLTKDITITGTGGNSGSSNIGVRTGSITTTAGNISITGTSVGDITGSINQGVAIGGAPTTSSGDITITGTGGAGVTNCVGVNIIAFTGPTTTDGLITITGTGGGGAAGTGNHGVEVSETSITSSGASFTAGKGIIIDGTGGSGTAGENHGVHDSFGGTIPISTVANPISITGVGGSGGDTNRGISFENPLTITSTDTGTTGTITLDGTGGSGSGSCDGAFLSSAFDGFDIDSDAAAISITGLGGASATGTDNNGVVIGGGTDITSTTGSITIDGTASSGAGVTDDNNGVLISNTGTTINSSGDVSITGLGGGIGDRNMGVNAQDSASITTSGAGEIAITGTGAAGAAGDDFNHGVSFDSVTLTPTSGDTTVMGTGGAAGGECNGIHCTTLDFKSSGGAIEFTGIGAGTNARGISLSSSTFEITGGSLEMTGTGAGTGSTTMGIRMVASMITGISSAPITMMGTASTTAFSEAFGVTITGAASEVMSDSGKITITGIGGGTAGGFGLNHGVTVGGTGVTGTSTAEVEIIGTGGSGPSFCSGVMINGPSQVITASGDLSIDGTGGSVDSTTSYGIFINRAGGGGSSEVFSDSGTMTLLGKEGGTDNRGIRVTSNGVVSTSSSSVFVTTMSDLLIDNGGSIIGGSGLLTFDIDRDLTITGDGSTSGIFPGSGGVTIATGRDLTLIGPDLAAGGGVAQIGNNDAAGGVSDITFTSIGRNVLVDGAITTVGSGYSLIGHGGNGTINGGDILFTDVLGNITVQGADTSGGGTNGFAQIGHLTIFGETVSGDITMNARGNIVVTGGTAGVTGDARIGHGGPAVGTVTSSSMTLIANGNIAMTSQAGAGQAIISNLSISASDSLRLVVDNANPIAPVFGAATFSINSGSDLTMPNSSGEVRIYTVQPSQNTVGTTINGDVFVPTPVDVDDDNNQYGVYFPGGTFVGGAAFRVYYKTGTAVPVPNPMETILEFEEGTFYKLAVALSELQDRLPLFRYMRLANYPWHHPSFCGGKNACDPGFDPYSSFIFEDNVYWIGENSEEAI
ncbi:MAG: hypothetical protein ChlgKO_11430 [Chlamydiales bacterium]